MFHRLRLEKNNSLGLVAELGGRGSCRAANTGKSGSAGASPSRIRSIPALLSVLIAMGSLHAQQNPGKDSSDKPKTGPVGLTPYSAELVKEILADVKAHGDSRRGAAVFGSTTLACLSCHIVGGKGGTIGPD